MKFQFKIWQPLPAPVSLAPNACYAIQDMGSLHLVDPHKAPIGAGPYTYEHLVPLSEEGGQEAKNSRHKGKEPDGAEDIGEDLPYHRYPSIIAAINIA